MKDVLLKGWFNFETLETLKESTINDQISPHPWTTFSRTSSHSSISPHGGYLSFPLFLFQLIGTETIPHSLNDFNYFMFCRIICYSSSNNIKFKIWMFLSSVVTSLMKYLQMFCSLKEQHSLPGWQALFDYWLGHALLKLFHMLLFKRYFVLLKVSCLFIYLFIYLFIFEHKNVTVINKPPHK